MGTNLFTDYAVEEETEDLTSTGAADISDAVKDIEHAEHQPDGDETLFTKVLEAQPDAARRQALESDDDDPEEETAEETEEQVTDEGPDEKPGEEPTGRQDEITREIERLKVEHEQLKQAEMQRLQADRAKTQEADYDKDVQKFNTAFIDQFKARLAGEGDEKALLMFKEYTDHAVMNVVPQMIQEEVDRRLQDFGRLADGRRRFLEDEQMSQYHPFADEIMDLVSRGMPEKEAFKLVHTVMTKGGPAKEPASGGAIPIKRREKVALEKKRVAAATPGKATSRSTRTKMTAKEEEDMMQGFWKRTLGIQK